METKNFIKIVNAITGRQFIINADVIELQNEYYIYKILPISKREVGFKFVTPKKEETLIKSFITQFTNKYFEPAPIAYSGRYGSNWAGMTEKDKEFAYLHHRSNMYSKKDLLNQIKENANKKETEYVFSKYGFYHTHYGIGLFVLFGLNNKTAVVKMTSFLDRKEIPYSNEFSDARWVYRFVININKDVHKNLLNIFNKTL